MEEKAAELTVGEHGRISAEPGCKNSVLLPEITLVSENSALLDSKDSDFVDSIKEIQLNASFEKSLYDPTFLAQLTSTDNCLGEKGLHKLLLLPRICTSESELKKRLLHRQHSGILTSVTSSSDGHQQRGKKRSCDIDGLLELVHNIFRGTGESTEMQTSRHRCKELARYHILKLFSKHSLNPPFSPCPQHSPAASLTTFSSLQNSSSEAEQWQEQLSGECLESPQPLRDKWDDVWRPQVERWQSPL
ncbi:hypothetical protein Anapl_13447 [Anas platyrhynchos]|uniref:Uncharacterized protein n=1 Tax=Anas platyrhynchos TaxID=8839 RepID=R0M3Y8_ANAPL|nr:hypothetical protein Anapl_13447 [Anas platyrhynchos]